MTHLNSTPSPGQVVQHHGFHPMPVMIGEPVAPKPASQVMPTVAFDVARLRWRHLGIVLMAGAVWAIGGAITYHVGGWLAFFLPEVLRATLL